MFTFKSMFVAISFIVLFGLSTSVSHAQINGVYYMTSYSRQGGETDDTARIGRALTAITSAGGGRLVFGEGTYDVSSTIALPSSVILEGVSKKGVAVSPSMIRLTTSSIPLFTIDSNQYEISLRDIGLKATSNTGTTAIKAINATSNTSSLGFQFSNVDFNGFDRGIWVKSQTITNWQFDNVRLDHCAFVGVTTGIELDADNTGWNMSSIRFDEVPVGGFGMKLLRSGYVSMDLIIGNGVSSIADTFIYVESHGNLSIKNSQGERFTNQLVVNGSDITYPIVLTNNVFGKDVSFKDATVLSIGNFYGANNVDAKPVIKGNSHVTSISDRFCYESQTSRCNVSDFDIWPSSCATAGTPPSCTGGTPIYQASLIKLNSDNTTSGTPSGTNTAARALMSARTYVNDKVLLELGSSQGNYVYKVTRRSSDGWLSFEGTQNDPYRGYSFNAPLTIGTTSFSSLPSPHGAGTMLYCTNCQTGTSPCSSGGTGGALAVSTGSAWNCK